MTALIDSSRLNPGIKKHQSESINNAVHKVRITAKFLEKFKPQRVSPISLNMQQRFKNLVKSYGILIQILSLIPFCFACKSKLAPVTSTPRQAACEADSGNPCDEEIPVTETLEEPELVPEIEIFENVISAQNLEGSINISASLTSLKINWVLSDGSGVTGFLIVRRPDEAVSFRPVNGVTYAEGQLLPDGSLVVYAGSASSFDDFNIAAGSNVNYFLFSFNSDQAYKEVIEIVSPIPVGLDSAKIPSDFTADVEVSDSNAYSWFDDFDLDGVKDLIIL